MDTVYSVESAYWNLVYSIENLEVRQQSLQLAKDLLEKNQRSVEVGTLAPMEVLSARAEVATREADLIQAEAQIKSNEDQLRLLLGISEAEDRPTIRPSCPRTSRPTSPGRSTSDEALADGHRRTGPTCEISRIGIETDKLNLSYAKNQVLPELSLSASYSSPGIDGTQHHLRRQPPGRQHRLDTIPGDIGGALKQTTEVPVPQLEPRADPEPAPGQLLRPGQPGPGPARTCGRPCSSWRTRRTRRLPRGQERRPLGRGQLQADPGLHDGPRAGRAEARGRGGEAPGRHEHQLHGPVLPARPGQRPHLRAQRHHLLQRLAGLPRAGHGHEPEGQEHQPHRFRPRARLSRRRDGPFRPERTCGPRRPFSFVSLTPNDLTCISGGTLCYPRLKGVTAPEPDSSVGGFAMNRKLIRPDLTEIKERMSQDKERDKDSPVRKRMHPPTDTFAESYYYLKQMNKKTPDGRRLHGRPDRRGLHRVVRPQLHQAQPRRRARTCSSTRPASAASTRSAKGPQTEGMPPDGNDRPRRSG
ncbi:MAG: TolC family protein [Desulfomicrobium escambiense]|nr:TolC family protein [Desulfomicrobium escambiense]